MDDALALWRRNLLALVGAVFIGFTGFTLVMPFLPLYLAELGLTDTGSIAVWTGLTLGITPAITALLAPAWGRLADRVGRKILVVRSLVSFVVLMAAMGLAERPWHLVALRAVQGIFAGYGALCLAMAAESAPPGRLARSIGIVQSAQRLGPAVGPVIGGVVAGLVGLRQAFFVTSAFYAVGLVLVVLLYRDPPRESSQAPHESSRVTFGSILAFENVLLLMAVILVLVFVDRSLAPVLPLAVVETGTAGPRVPLVSGLIFSSIACGAAIGHHYTASVLRRWSARTVLSGATALAALAAGGLAAAPSAWLLGTAASAFGVAIGVALTAAYTVAAGVLPPGTSGLGFGVLTSASLIGMAIGPVVAGLLGRADVHTVFLADAVLLGTLALVVRRLMAEPQPETTAPVVEDA